MCAPSIEGSAIQATDEVRARGNAAGYFGVISGVLGASVLLPLPGADGRIAHLPSVCPFYLMTGLPCPGCGLTRAFVCIGHGRFAESLHWHPIGWLVYAGFVALWVYTGFHAIFGRRLVAISPDQGKRLGWASLVLLFGTGFIRIGWICVTHHNPF